MIYKLTKLFARYAEKHVEISHSFGPIEVRRRGPLLAINITGTQDAARIELGKITRHARGQNGLLHADAPFRNNAQGRVIIGQGKDAVTHPFGPFPKWKDTAARAALLPPFLMAGARAIPPALRWFRERDAAARIEVRNLFGLAPTTTALEIQEPVFAARRPDTTDHKITIILPVFNAFEMVQEALDHVVRHTDVPWRLIVIEDASSDERVRPWLQAWAFGRPDVTLLENAQNLGFIGSVNRGIAAALPHGDPVVLLNSDAFVPEGWASRLIAPLSDPDVASVTPMSNDAELMSVPILCQRSDLSAGQGAAIDAVASRLAGVSEEADLPTGVGFCMALSADWLGRVGLLDTAFGRGYGEEVDWCQRAIAMGARHVAQPALFVEHRGGTSFGSEEKQRLIEANSQIVSARHPRFDQDVQDYIATDPLLGARIALALGLCAGQDRVPVYIAHDMGGGAEADLMRRIGHETQAGQTAVVLRVGGAYRWQIEVHGPTGVLRGGTENQRLIRKYLDILPRREMIYSCAVGDPDPVLIPAFLCETGQGQALRVLLHDYFPISPAYTLLDDAGGFRGVPEPGQEGRVDRIRRPDGTRVPLAEWQAAWGALLAQADVVEVFSEASAELLRGAYPDLENVAVVPHALLQDIPLLEPNGGAPVVGVLGNMNAHKGAAIVSALSRKLARGQVVLLGQMAPGHRMGRGGIEHGAYDLSELPELARRYGITRWLIPSVWPETFSFTTHEALATGLPTFAFDLGGQGDAVRVAPHGHVLPLGGDIDSLAKRLLEEPS